LAFKTGGLKDTVKEFDTTTLKGNGVNFEAHKAFDLIFAIKRAFDIFHNKKFY
jgi:starch synthase